MSTLQQNWRKGQNSFCLEVRGVRGREKGWGTGVRNDPNNAYTYEYMNKEKKTCFLRLTLFHVFSWLIFSLSTLKVFFP
jgi:hypothetical protein